MPQIVKSAEVGEVGTERVEDLSGEVSLEAADDVSFGSMIVAEIAAQGRTSVRFCADHAACAFS
jgi:hypothetical protein